MKKLISVVLAVVMMMLLVPFSAMAEENIQHIKTEEELVAIDEVVGNFVLDNDITVSAGFEPLTIAVGTVLDGAGYSIKGINMSFGDYTNIGFIGVNEGTVKNINVENPNILGGDQVGGFVGWNAGRIENCHVIGGRVMGVIDTTYSDPTQIGNIIGGFAGANYPTDNATNPEIIGCSVVDTYVGGFRSIGGFVGINAGKIEQSYVSGVRVNTEVESNTKYIDYFKKLIVDTGRMAFNFVGNFAAENIPGATITNCYAYNGSTFGIENVAGFVALNVGRITFGYSHGAVKGVSLEWNITGTDEDGEWYQIVSYNTRNIHMAISAVKNSGYTGTGSAANFFFPSASGYASSNGTTAVADMTNKDTFRGFDFDTIWTMDKTVNNGMPSFAPFGVYYNVTFKYAQDINEVKRNNFTGVVTVKVEEGAAAQAPAIPEIEGATFIAWDNEFDSVTSNLEVIALYSVEVYEVTFVDGVTGVTLATVEVKYGDAAPAPAAPEHEGYEFKGWDKDFASVKEDMTVTAIYEKAGEVEPTMYTVTFVDGLTSETIAEVKVEEGKAAEAPEAPAHEGYKFTGWDKDFTNVTEDMTVTAIYEEVIEPTMYTVTFIDGLTQEVIATVEVEEGKAAQAPEAPAHEGYKFTGWDKDFSNVTENMTVTAIYQESVIIEPTMYTVTFVDGLTGEVIATVEVEEYYAATAPEAPVHEGYTFKGWDKDFESVTEDMTVTAIYEKIEVSTSLRGDADLNEKVEAADATVVLRYVADLETLNDQQMKNGDANLDGGVDSADATSILRFVAGLGWD